jgi:hypothetical protein
VRGIIIFLLNLKGPVILAKTPKFLLVSMLFASSVFAQPAAPSATPAAGGEVDISVKQRPTLSPQEMVQQGKEYFRNMNDTLVRIQTLQETARRQKDIIKLNCVTDKLVQAKVNINIAEQATNSLQETIARADEGGRTHEFTRLTIVNQKVLVLGAEAENCIGEDLSFVGATRVDVEVDPNIPQTDPTVPPLPIINLIRPPPASSFL